MAFDTIVYELDTLDAKAFFDYAGYKARNMREPMRAAGHVLLDHIEEAFESEGESVGEFWEDLTEAYKPRKQKEWGFIYPILVASEHLKPEATSRRTISVTNFELYYNLDVEYAAVHQYGGGNEIPARPYVVVTEQLIQEIEDVFRDWLNDLKARNVRRRNLAIENPFD